MMPVLVTPSEPVTPHVVPAAPSAMPVMTTPMRPVPMVSVAAMPAPVAAVSGPPVWAVGPGMVSTPVRPVPMVPVPVMRVMKPRAGEGQRRHRDEERHAGSEESEELNP